MDHFGIGQAMRGMARVFFQSARQTGRTTSLIESLKDGDRVVFANLKTATDFQRLCNKRKLAVDCVVIPPRDPGQIKRFPPSDGRTVFDHTWVEIYYEGAIENAGDDIDHLQRETSGVGTAHLETRHAAQQLVKWHG
jgi:hypothetical protein